MNPLGNVYAAGYFSATSLLFILPSGYDASAKDVALENGADVFLEKPFTRDQLYQSIMGLMN